MVIKARVLRCIKYHLATERRKYSRTIRHLFMSQVMTRHVELYRPTAGSFLCQWPPPSRFCRRQSPFPPPWVGDTIVGLNKDIQLTDRVALIRMQSCKRTGGDPARRCYVLKLTLNTSHIYRHRLNGQSYRRAWQICEVTLNQIGLTWLTDRNS